MEQLYQLIYKLCNLDFCTNDSYGANFGGGEEPCVLKYARKQYQYIRDISRFASTEEEEDILIDRYEVVTASDHFDKNLLGLYYI